jgi:hypothetical protein
MTHDEWYKKCQRRWREIRTIIKPKEPNMIQDEIGYGEGWEKATEPGPDVEILMFKNNDEVIWKWEPRKKYDITAPLHPECSYRKPIKPKEEKMTFEAWFRSHENDEWKSTRQQLAQKAYDAGIKAGEEAKRIMEADKIKAGDFVQYDIGIKQIKTVERTRYWLTNGTWVTLSSVTKIANPAHIKAMTEIFEAMK